MLDRAAAATAHVARVLATAGLVGLFANAVAVVADVVLRAAFSAPIDRLSDVSSVVFIVCAACCLPAATASRRHITIRALDRLRAPRLKAGVEAFAALATAIAFGLIAWQVGKYAGELAASGQTLSQIAIPVAPVWYFVTACLAFNGLIALQVLAEMLRAVWRAAPTAAAPADDPGLL